MLSWRITAGSLPGRNPEPVPRIDDRNDGNQARKFRLLEDCSCPVVHLVGHESVRQKRDGFSQFERCYFSIRIEMPRLRPSGQLNDPFD